MRRWRPFATGTWLVLGIPAMDLLGISIMMAAAPLYSAYVQRTALLGVGVMADQQVGGAVMWMFGAVVQVGALLFALREWARANAREAGRLERRGRSARVRSRARSPQTR